MEPSKKTAIVAARTAARESPKQSIRASTEPLRFAALSAALLGGLLVGKETVSRREDWVAVVLSIVASGSEGLSIRGESVSCARERCFFSVQSENSDKRARSPWVKHFDNKFSSMKSASDLALTVAAVTTERISDPFWLEIACRRAAFEQKSRLPPRWRLVEILGFWAFT
ncbi:MAG TPA: hypothetical protein VLK56_06470 [Solirubrobacterales bacterium]|nr:hypothetical protein [Solirubrobacterales bacterium]